MRRLMTAGVAAIAMTVSIPAFAGTVITFNNGAYTYPYPTTATVFENFDSGTVGSNYATPNPTPGGTGITETTTGTDNLIESGTAASQYVDPSANGAAGAGSPNYLAVGANSTFKVNFTTPVQFFSFILGSLDTYNQLALTFAGSSTPTIFTGGQIIGNASASQVPGANGNGNSATGGRVVFDTAGGAGITSATFSSPFQAFEIDELSSAVPEPAVWGLMILGFGLIGSQLRARRRKVTFATA